jgi:regulator of protease activity HflC (stomatin/prohibitin superfamily)
MLTGDENIIDVSFVVFWRILEPVRYLFNVQNPETTVRDLAESVLREAVGQSEIRPLLTNARQHTEETARKLVQDMLHQYGTDIRVDQVRLQRVDTRRGSSTRFVTCRLRARGDSLPHTVGRRGQQPSGPVSERGIQEGAGSDT